MTSQQPAYPTNNSHAQQSDGQCGLTKLDYFAGQALQSIHLQVPADATDAELEPFHGFIARTALGVAEALCAELDKRKENQ